MYTEEKPPIEEVLVHYGVEGMKRGVRKVDPVMDARARLHARVMSGAKVPSTSGTASKQQGWSDAARVAALATRLKNFRGMKLSQLDKQAALKKKPT